jgi:glutaminyl-peptide cyclotransferase
VVEKLKIYYRCLLAGVAVVFIASCNGKDTPAAEETIIQPEQKVSATPLQVPQLNADSAYAFVKKQVDFGPRIPGTKAHQNCADWISSKLKEYSMEVTVQKGIVATFDNRKFELKNIIASYNPSKSQRILLCTHWDTRPFADRDEGSKKNKTFDGANDGGSGTGVLIEIARQLSISKPDVGIDLIFFDLEDYGQTDESTFPNMEHSWCLGSQYWAKNPHKAGYYARYGILLDMVGAKGAVFPKEGTSIYYASSIVERVWNTAAQLGYGSFFINAKTAPITDDHLYINQLANIPCIDIIHYNLMDNDFFDHHHRVSDNMEQIDPKILGMVGQVLMQVIFEDAAKPGS